MYQSQDVNGASTTYAYGTSTTCAAHTFLTQVTLPVSSLSSSATWDCNGGVVTQTMDANSQPTNIAYTDPYFWRPYSSNDPLSNQTTFYYPAPNVVAHWMVFNSSNSVVSNFQFLDGFGRTSSAEKSQYPSSPNVDTVSYTFDSMGRSYSVSMPCSIAYTGAAGTCSTPQTTQTYDALSRPYVTTDGGGGTATYTYSQNDVLQTVGPHPTGETLKQKQLEYDALGRLISVCEVTAGTTSAPAGSCGQNTALPSPPGTGYLTIYAYAFSGGYNQVTVTQNAQSSTTQTRTYLYDLMGRLVSETNPESGTTQYVYDTNSGTCASWGYPNFPGDLLAKYDAKGNASCYFYDNLHRVTAIYYQGPYTTPSKHFYYDYYAYSNSKGRLSGAYTCTYGVSTCVGNVLTDTYFSYSARGEITDVYESTPSTAGSYYHTTGSYWANGALNTLALFNSSGSALIPTQTYGVDGEGRSTTVSASSGQNPVTSVSYNPASQPTAVTFGSADNDAFTYDSNTGRMTQYKFNVGSGPQSVIGNLTWNSNGSLGTLAITDPINSANAQTCTYAHDDLSRIASTSCGSTWSQTFAFDAFSNVTKSGSMNWACPTCYDASSNHYNHTLSPLVSYDNNGNLTNDTFHTYTWDAEGHPVTLDSQQFTYDALGRVVELKNPGPAYVQVVYGVTGGRLALMVGQNLARAYVPLPGGATAYYTGTGLAYYRHSDWVGSSRLTTTPSRTVYFDGAYAPYGESYSTSGTSDPSFAGQNQDLTTGIYEAMFRRYHPTQGRWISPDPAGMAAVDPTNPQTWNRYAYVLNNPLSLVDPLGLDGQCDDHGNCTVTGTAGSGGSGGSDGSGPAPTNALPAGVCASVYLDGGDTGTNTCGGFHMPRPHTPPFALLGRLNLMAIVTPPTKSARCPGRIASAINSAVVMGLVGPPAGGARALAAATGHVVTIGYDANATLRIGTFGGSIHAGDALAFDSQGNIALISTTGAGGGFGGDVGFTGQLGILRATSVLGLESGSTPTYNVAAGEGAQGAVGTDLEGNLTLSFGAGEGIATSSTVDVSHVSVVACGPG